MAGAAPLHTQRACVIKVHGGQVVDHKILLPNLETNAKTIRLVREHSSEYASKYEAIKTIAGRLGMNPETPRVAADARCARRPSSHGCRAQQSRRPEEPPQWNRRPSPSDIGPTVTP